MGIKAFEGRLERAVEGTMSRFFKSGLSPVEFGRKLVREMDASRTVGVDGRTIVPNSFEFQISLADSEQLSDLLGNLNRELSEAAREHAHDEGYTFVGPVEVAIEPSEKVRSGMLVVKARFAEGEGGRNTGSLLLPTGDSVPLGEYVVTIGRQGTSTIVLADPNVSRNHAEIRPYADGFAVFDLGSTNGTRVNGVKVVEQALHDGDEVKFGNTVIHYRAS